MLKMFIKKQAMRYLQKEKNQRMSPWDTDAPR